MDIKPRPNHARYIAILQSMTPEQRLNKAFELTASAKELFRAGLRQCFPDATPEDLHAIYLKRLELCHNRNY